MALSPAQLAWIDETKEVRIETLSSRGTRKTIIWVVVTGGDVYVRSVRAEDGHWYQRALSNPLVAIDVDGERVEFRAVLVDDADQIMAVTDALQAKYPRGGSLDRMTREEVLDTTLRLDPIE
jgi:hypothetical protein